MKKKHYVNNAELLESLLDYQKRCRKAKREKISKPKIPDYVAISLMQIAEKFSHRPNFASYTFRDEMIADAIENCIMYIDNFDPKKSRNPFAYFTQIIYYAFIRRIEKEKKQLYVKYKSTENFGVLDEFDQMSSENGTTNQFEMYENISTFIEKFETSKQDKLNTIKKKKKARLKNG